MRLTWFRRWLWWQELLLLAVVGASVYTEHWASATAMVGGYVAGRILG